MAPTQKFSGSTYIEALDGVRLGAQMLAVRAIMSDGGWRTPEEIAAAMPQQATVASVTARLRDLRKPRFGGHVVERRRRGDGKSGSHEYRLVTSGPGLASTRPVATDLDAEDWDNVRRLAGED